MAPRMRDRYILAPHFFATFGAFPQVIYWIAVCIAIVFQANPSPMSHLHHVGGFQTKKNRFDLEIGIGSDCLFKNVSGTKIVM